MTLNAQRRDRPAAALEEAVPGTPLVNRHAIGVKWRVAPVLGDHRAASEARRESFALRGVEPVGRRGSVGEHSA